MPLSKGFSRIASLRTLRSLRTFDIISDIISEAGVRLVGNRECRIFFNSICVQRGHDSTRQGEYNPQNYSECCAGKHRYTGNPLCDCNGERVHP